MRNILIVYSTTDGHTKKVCQFLSECLVALGHSVALHEIKAIPDKIKQFDQIIVGASIRYGKHNPTVNQFIQHQAEKLKRTPSAFFSVNLVARKPEKCSPQTNPYVRKFLASIDWTPSHSAVFAGRLNYSMYSFWDKHMIRFIMWLTKGPTALETDQEFTDWDQVRQFADVIANLEAANDQPQSRA